MKFSRLLAVSSALVLVAVGSYATATLRQGPVAPTEAHKWMTTHAGMWDAKVSGMMGESKGTWEVKSGPGGLWNIGEFKADMMGMPFHGMEFMGYDPDSKTFTTIWIDSMSARAQTMTGSYDKATKTLTTKGEMVGMDGQMTDSMGITHFADADTMSFKMVMGTDAAAEPMMTIEYKRRK